MASQVAIGGVPVTSLLRPRAGGWPATFPVLDRELERAARQMARRFATTAQRLEDGPGEPGGVLVWKVPGSPTGRELATAASAVAQRLAAAPVVLVDVHRDGLGLDPLDAARRAFAEVGATVAFAGFAPAPPLRADRVVVVLVGDWYVAPTPAPEDFKVVAIMTAFNEADIVRPSIQRLIAQGIEVHLIDNWSVDGTGDLVADLVGHGLRTIERYPEGGRPEGYEWTNLLEHVADIAPTLDADWIIHHDVDQRRDAPWPGVALRDGLYAADRAGFDAVDHTIFEFRPTDDRFVDGTEVSDHLVHFELVPSARSAVHVQAWRNRARPDLASTGGHDAQFEGRRVYPFNFALRHYPIRSQRHGDRKVFRDRKPRYDAAELAKGWHYHYARLRDGHQFILDPADLHRYEPERFGEDYLLPLIGQVCIPTREPGAANTAKAAAVDLLDRTGALPRAVELKDKVTGRR